MKDGGGRSEEQLIGPQATEQSEDEFHIFGGGTVETENDFDLFSEKNNTIAAYDSVKDKPRSKESVARINYEDAYDSKITAADLNVQNRQSPITAAEKKIHN